jgi:hypothetical protein
VPFYYFDLLIDGEPQDQGGMILEEFAVAADRADALASELRIIRPELVSKQCFVRVIAEDNAEIYRTPLNPVPQWSMKSGIPFFLQTLQLTRTGCSRGPRTRIATIGRLRRSRLISRCRGFGREVTVLRRWPCEA